MSLAGEHLGASPAREAVDGSPFQPGQAVVVVRSAEPEDGGCLDVLRYVGCSGVVEHLDYSCGCGQSYPGDPMVGVRLADGRLQEFWREELEPAKNCMLTPRSRGCSLDLGGSP